jgi:hypothetical protein
VKPRFPHGGPRLPRPHTVSGCCIRLFDGWDGSATGARFYMRKGAESITQRPANFSQADSEKFPAAASGWVEPSSEVNLTTRAHMTEEPAHVSATPAESNVGKTTSERTPAGSKVVALPSVSRCCWRGRFWLGGPTRQRHSETHRRPGLGCQRCTHTDGGSRLRGATCRRAQQQKRAGAGLVYMGRD